MGDQWFNDVKMPHYHGVEGSIHELDETFTVAGLLPDWRVFELIVDPGFRFDGCSIPRPLWRLCGHPLEVPRIAAALAHDWLYAAQLTDRETADQVFMSVCLEVGLGWLRREVEYLALRLFGWGAWISKKDADRISARACGTLWIEGKKLTGDNENA